MRRVHWILWGLCAATIGAAQGALAADQPATPSSAPPPASAASSAPSETAPSDETLHAIGLLLSRQLAAFQLSESEFKKVVTGFGDGFHHPQTIAAAQAQLSSIQSLARTRMSAAAEKQKKAGEAYLEKAAALPGATKTATGLVYIPISPGSGASPTAADQVKVNYTGKLVNGQVFDSSASHGGPATFPLGAVVPCWTQALQLMKVGGKGRVVCPSALAYGDRGQPPVILPGATLDFQIELLDVLPAPKPVPPPSPPGSGLTRPSTPGAAPPAPPAPPHS